MIINIVCFDILEKNFCAIIIISIKYFTEDKSGFILIRRGKL